MKSEWYEGKRRIERLPIAIATILVKGSTQYLKM